METLLPANKLQRVYEKGCRYCMGHLAISYTLRHEVKNKVIQLPTEFSILSTFITLSEEQY